MANNPFGTTAAPQSKAQPFNNVGDTFASTNPTANLGGVPAFNTNHNMSSTSGLSTDNPASTSTPFGFSNAIGQSQGSSATTNPFGSNQASTTPFGIGEGGGGRGFGSNTSMNAFGSTSNQQPSAFAPDVACQSQPFETTATTGTTTSQTPFGQQIAMSTTANTPFEGATNAMTSNPFGLNQTPSNPAINAFGAQAGQPATNPAFGAQAIQPATTPFGAQANQPVTNPFGAQANQPTTTPFGAQSKQSATTPFGAPGGRI